MVKILGLVFIFITISQQVKCNQPVWVASHLSYHSRLDALGATIEERPVTVIAARDPGLPLRDAWKH